MASIIIPAYNTELYIHEMLECVINQTYRNLQIIVVDDGSKDNTAHIIKKFAEKDARIEYVCQENKGVSAARNNGMSRIQGDYVFFFDSDDTFESDLIELCVRYATENNVETVLYGHADNIDGVLQNRHVFSLKGNYVGASIVREIMPCFMGESYADVNAWIQGKRVLREGKEHTALWRMMFDAKVLKRSGLQFDTKLTVGEDTKFINEYLLSTSSVGIMDKCLYFLRIRPGSANVTSIGNPKLMLENKIKLITAREEIDGMANAFGYSTEDYWKGTVVLSAVQLALHLANNKRLTRSENNSLYNLYISNSTVKKCIKEFMPSWGVKGIPFHMLRMNLSGLLFVVCSILPQKIVKRLG